MRNVEGHGRHSVRGQCRSVTGTAHERQGQRREYQRLGACGDPVPPFREISTHGKKGAEQDQEAVTRQPYQAGSRIENGVPHGAEFERRVGTILEDGCPPQQPDDP